MLEPDGEGCAQYEVQLRTSTRRFFGGIDDVLVGEHALALSQAALFLRPNRIPNNTEIRVRSRVSEGWRLVSPWPEENDELQAGPDGLRRLTTFGLVSETMPVRQLEVAGTALTWTRAGELAVPDDELERWLTQRIADVAAPVGDFPVERLVILLFPSGGGPSSGVRFGLVRRGGGASVVFFLSPRSPMSVLEDDWVITHELSHLLIPGMTRQDRWAAEGFATYMQEILRARAGRISEQEAWIHLVEGFERGEVRRRSETLAASSERFGNVSRIYWQGTAAFLEMDIALRRQGSSLLERVRENGWRVSARDQARSSESVFRALDGGEAGIITEIGARYASSRNFPFPRAMLEELGVQREPPRVRLTDEAPLAPIRISMTARD